MNAIFVLSLSCTALAFDSAAPPATSPSIAAPPSATALAPPSDAGSADWSRPVGIREVLVARPFLLAEPFESDWREERPLVQSGWILVLEVDSGPARVRQMASPVLYVGDEIAERLNLGAAPGMEPGETVRLVVLVRSPLDEAGEVAPILDEAPVFFGSPMLPEEVDAVVALRERAAAIAAGLRPTAPTQVAGALARGGPALRIADRAALLASAATLVRTWSPAESEHADLLEGKPITREATPDRP